MIEHASKFLTYDMTGDVGQVPALTIDDIDFREVGGTQCEGITLESETHRHWVLIGPAGAVSLTATPIAWGDCGADLPDGAVESNCGGWLFPNLTALLHRPGQGEHCPITQGPCTHAPGPEITETVQRWYDSNDLFDGLIFDELTAPYEGLATEATPHQIAAVARQDASTP